MLNDSDHKYWKAIAEHDIDTVDLLLKENGHIDITIYHMHQAVEKLLKGLIIKNGKGILFIHDLKRLYAILCQIDGAFSRIMDKLGIENVNIHTLRHTFASHCILNGIDILSVKEFLGHSRVTTTEIYTHLNQTFKSDQIQKLDGLLELALVS